MKIPVSKRAAVQRVNRFFKKNGCTLSGAPKFGSCTLKATKPGTKARAEIGEYFIINKRVGRFKKEPDKIVTAISLVQWDIDLLDLLKKLDLLKPYEELYI